MGIVITVLSSFLVSPLCPPDECFLRLISWLLIFLSFCQLPWKFYSHVTSSFRFVEITSESIAISLTCFRFCITNYLLGISTKFPTSLDISVCSKLNSSSLRISQDGDLHWDAFRADLGAWQGCRAHGVIIPAISVRLPSVMGLTHVYTWLRYNSHIGSCRLLHKWSVWNLWAIRVFIGQGSSSCCWNNTKISVV